MKTLTQPERQRQFTPGDGIIFKLDKLLKSALGPHVAGRPYPAEHLAEPVKDAATRQTRLRV